MDEVTQQNSALVEENAATAKTLEHQASAMAADERIAFFKPRGSSNAGAALGGADGTPARRRAGRGETGGQADAGESRAPRGQPRAGRPHRRRHRA